MRRPDHRPRTSSRREEHAPRPTTVARRPSHSPITPPTSAPIGAAGEERHREHRRRAAAEPLVDVQLDRGVARHHAEHLRRSHHEERDERDTPHRRQPEQQVARGHGRAGRVNARCDRRNVSPNHDHEQPADDRAGAVATGEQPYTPGPDVEDVPGDRLDELHDRDAEQRDEHHHQHRDDEHLASARRSGFPRGSARSTPLPAPVLASGRDRITSSAPITTRNDSALSAERVRRPQRREHQARERGAERPGAGELHRVDPDRAEQHRTAAPAGARTTATPRW